MTEQRITRLEERVDDVDDRLRKVEVIVDGPPRADSIRGRLHKLESDAAAARAAEAAVSAALAVRADAKDRVFGRSEKVIALLLAFVVVLLQIVSFFFR